MEIPNSGSLWRVKPQALMEEEFVINRHLPNQYFRIGHIEAEGKDAGPGTEVVAVSHVSTWRGTIRRLHERFTKAEDMEMAK